MNNEINLIGKSVIHGTYGVGEVVKKEDKKIVVLFKTGEKRFIYPDTFESFLKFEDETLQQFVLDEIKRSKEEKVAKYLADTKQENNAPEANLKPSDRLNIAFRCNYCDKGKSEKMIGFKGPCNKYQIKYNIEVENYPWCMDNSCLCKQYYDRLVESGGYNISFPEMLEHAENLEKWNLFEGVSLWEDEFENNPLKSGKIQKDSLVFLTTKAPDKAEDERFIFAVFIASDIVCDDEYIINSSKYKIFFTENEARQLIFWNYFEQSPDFNSWHPDNFNYLNNNQAISFLKDMVKVKENTKDAIYAKEFYNYFASKI